MIRKWPSTLLPTNKFTEKNKFNNFFFDFLLSCDTSNWPLNQHLFKWHFPHRITKIQQQKCVSYLFLFYSKICALFSGFEQIALYKLTTKRKRWKYNSFTVCHETTTINIYYKWRRLKGCNVLTSDEAFYSYHKKRFWCTVPCFWIVLNLKLIAFFHWNCSKSINELISAQTISIQRNILHWEPFHNYIYIE